MAKEKKINPKNKAAVAQKKEEEKVIQEQKEIEAREAKKNTKKPKKKMTAVERQRIILKITGWIMAIVMFAGSIIALFSYLIGYQG